MANITIILLWGFTALILLTDLWLLKTNRKTYSQKMIEWSRYTMAIPFAWGFLMGHWFG